MRLCLPPPFHLLGCLLLLLDCRHRRRRCCRLRRRRLVRCCRQCKIANGGIHAGGGIAERAWQLPVLRDAINTLQAKRVAAAEHVRIPVAHCLEAYRALTGCHRFVRG
jgi:hypothetical protein